MVGPAHVSSIMFGEVQALLSHKSLYLDTLALEDEPRNRDKPASTLRPKNPADPYFFEKSSVKGIDGARPQRQHRTFISRHSCQETLPKAFDDPQMRPKQLIPATVNRPDLILNITDIEGTKPHPKDIFINARNTNPLQPQYQLPQCPEPPATPEPRGGSSPSLDVSDIAGAQPQQRWPSSTRATQLDVSDICTSTSAWKHHLRAQARQGVEPLVASGLPAGAAAGGTATGIMVPQRTGQGWTPVASQLIAHASTAWQEIPATIGLQQTQAVGSSYGQWQGMQDQEAQSVQGAGWQQQQQQQQQWAGAWAPEATMQANGDAWPQQAGGGAAVEYDVGTSQQEPSTPQSASTTWFRGHPTSTQSPSRPSSACRTPAPSHTPASRKARPQSAPASRSTSTSTSSTAAPSRLQQTFSVRSRLQAAPSTVPVPQTSPKSPATSRNMQPSAPQHQAFTSQPAPSPASLQQCQHRMRPQSAPSRPASAPTPPAQVHAPAAIASILAMQRVAPRASTAPGTATSTPRAGVPTRTASSHPPDEQQVAPRASTAADTATSTPRAGVPTRTASSHPPDERQCQEWLGFTGGWPPQPCTPTPQKRPVSAIAALMHGAPTSGTKASPPSPPSSQPSQQHPASCNRYTTYHSYKAQAYWFSQTDAAGQVQQATAWKAGDDQTLVCTIRKPYLGDGGPLQRQASTADLTATRQPIAPAAPIERTSTISWEMKLAAAPIERTSTISWEMKLAAAGRADPPPVKRWAQHGAATPTMPASSITAAPAASRPAAGTAGARPARPQSAHACMTAVGSVGVGQHRLHQQMAREDMAAVRALF